MFGGARLRVFWPKWLAFVGYADIGAGGAKISWQAYAGLDVRFQGFFGGRSAIVGSTSTAKVMRMKLKLTKAGIYAGLDIRF